MTLADLRKLAKAKGYRARACRRAGDWYVTTETAEYRFGPDATHPLRAVAIRMVALGLRATPRRKP